MNLTTKQTQILTVLIKANPDGTFCDIDQLLERLESEHDWKTSKPSIQFSIRAMIKAKTICRASSERRRGRIRTVLAPTGLGYQVMSGMLRAAL